MVLLSTHPSVSILNWDNPLQNPITKAIGISPNENKVKQYFLACMCKLTEEESKAS